MDTLWQFFPILFGASMVFNLAYYDNVQHGVIMGLLWFLGTACIFSILVLYLAGMSCFS